MSARTQVTQKVAEFVKDAEAQGWQVDAPANKKVLIFHTPQDEKISVPMQPGELVFKQFEKKILAAGLRVGASRTSRVTAARASQAASEASLAAAVPEAPVAAPEAPAAVVEVAVVEVVDDLNQTDTSDKSAIAVRAAEVAAYPKFKGPDGRYWCHECALEGRTYSVVNPQGLSAHRKGAHQVDGTTFIPSVIQKVRSDSPLAGIGTAVDLLLSEVAKVTAGTDPAALATVTEDRDRVKRDYDVVFANTLRLGDQITAIREAIETLPMAKAYAAIAEIVGEGG